jgi:hypothetical protein
VRKAATGIEIPQETREVENTFGLREREREREKEKKRKRKCM